MKFGTCNLFGLVDDILPHGGQPTFISIAQNKACIIGSMMPRLTIKHISLDFLNELSACIGKLIVWVNFKASLVLDNDDYQTQTLLYKNPPLGHIYLL